MRKYTGTAKRADVGEVSRGHRCETAGFKARTPSPSQMAIGSELKEATRRAMARLSPDYREILRLRQEEHLTMREAAERMGRSVKAVEKLYGRALARLAQLLNLKSRSHE